MESPPPPHPPPPPPPPPSSSSSQPPPPPPPMPALYGKAWSKDELLLWGRERQWEVILHYLEAPTSADQQEREAMARLDVARFWAYLNETNPGSAQKFSMYPFRFR
ncbi:hypothetical protein E8E13_010485 [Curvularia kusanoi]|uniref:Uncharacterized protein n=1 Tax=Curvularia kusanoi TaxID=90978 RepID=A0A9P4TLX2_CURKU|nr:hypothetical protein E8E13_010485 [Curvularia kusanoi]